MYVLFAATAVNAIIIMIVPPPPPGKWTGRWYGGGGLNEWGKKSHQLAPSRYVCLCVCVWSLYMRFFEKNLTVNHRQNRYTRHCSRMRTSIFT